jgi:hypothetical protein
MKISVLRRYVQLLELWGSFPSFLAAVEDMKGTMVEEYIDAGISMPVCPKMSKGND